jgi:hypothetical protein
MYFCIMHILMKGLGPSWQPSGCRDPCMNETSFLNSYYYCYELWMLTSLIAGISFFCGGTWNSGENNRLSASHWQILLHKIVSNAHPMVGNRTSKSSGCRDPCMNETSFQRWKQHRTLHRRRWRTFHKCWASSRVVGLRECTCA